MWQSVCPPGCGDVSQGAQISVGSAAHLVRVETAPAAQVPAPQGPVEPSTAKLCGAKRLKIDTTPQAGALGGIPALPPLATPPATVSPSTPPAVVSMPKIFFTDLTEVTRKLQSAIKQLLQELRAAESLRGGLLVSETIAAHCEVAGLAPPPVFNEQTLDDFLTDCQQRLLDLSLKKLECRAPEPPGVTINNLVHRWLFLPEKVDAWVVFAAGTGAYEKAGTVADGVLKPLSPSPLTLITLKEGKAPSVRNYSVEEDLKELPTEMKAAYSAARAASRLRPSFSLVPGQPPSPSMADVVVGIKYEVLSIKYRV